jgi:N-acyl amino acid synthase of PEP-CTERM/exosortase system
MLYYQAAEKKEQFSPVRNTKLSDAYNHWFKVVPADTPELLEQAYRLRYQVYCCEHDYETPDEQLEQRETDEFDSRSVHNLLIDRASGAVTGTVRLVLPDQKTPEKSFPIQQICSHPLLADRIITSTAAEISRFAVSKRIRQMADGFTSPVIDHHGDCPIDRRNLKSYIALGLMKATMQMSFEHGITDWFAVMEPSLLRLLSRFSIYFKPIGSLVAYHGMRQPCHANVGALLERVRRENFELWEFVTESSRSLKDRGIAFDLSA